MGVSEAHDRTLSPGTVLDEKYRIDELIAVGGMGAVYLGTHTLLQKKVAIKLLRADLADCTDAMERFRREAIAASKIGHDNICEVTDLGETAWGASFLVMEHLEGQSLAALLKQRGRLQVSEACDLVLPILSAIDAAHRAGIVHRDLKPANVFLADKSSGDTIKVLDFGISRVQGAEASDLRLTQTGTILGTPAYMSPEQARGEINVGPTSDIYAIGVLLYELLTGHLPFEDNNYNQLIFRVAAGDFPAPREIVPDLLVDFEQIILKAMALLPKDRYADAKDFANALLPFSQGARPSFLRDNARLPHVSATSDQARAMGTAQTVASQRHLPDQSSSATIAGYPEDTGRKVLLESGLAGESSDVSHAKTSQPLEAARQPRMRMARWLMLPVVMLGCVALAWTFLREAPAKEASGSLTMEENADESAPVPQENERATDLAAQANVDVEKADAAKETAEPAPTPPNVTIDLVTNPSRAAVLLDGREIMTRELSVPKDDKNHTIVVKASGYQQARDTIRFDMNQRLSFALIPEVKKKTQSKKRSHKKRRSSKSRKSTRGKRLADENPYEN